MLLKELFDKHSVECPYWLQFEFLEDELLDCEYSLKGNVHEWILNDSMQKIIIRYDGETYYYCAFDEDNLLLLRKEMTEEYCTVS